MKLVIPNEQSMTAALANLSDDERTKLANQMLRVAARHECMRQPLAWESLSVIYAVSEVWHADYLATDDEVEVVNSLDAFREVLEEGGDEILVRAQAGLTLALIKYLLASCPYAKTVYWQAPA